MTAKEAAKLAETIRQEAWRTVQTKVGQVNGQPVVHVIDKGADDSRTASVNVRSLGEWRVHPLHPYNRPSKRQQEQELLAEASAALDNIPSAPSAIKAALGGRSRA